jgi:hypothetical protein
MMTRSAHEHLTITNALARGRRDKLFRLPFEMATAGKTGVTMRAMGRQGLMASMQGYGCMGLTAFYGAALEDEDGLKVCLVCL